MTKGRAGFLGNKREQPVVAGNGVLQLEKGMVTNAISLETEGN